MCKYSLLTSISERDENTKKNNYYVMLKIEFQIRKLLIN